MQKKIIALAVAGLASTAAFAQTNVTIYGIVDAAVAYTGNSSAGKDVWAVQSGVLAGSRLGFKGTEDLGNGLKAVFQLEQGFNVDDGSVTVSSTSSNSTYFQRQAFVGLSSATAGTLTFGRQYAPGYDAFNRNDAVAGALLSAGVTLANVSGATIANNSNARWNNAVKYVSPTFAGLTATAIYRFGEGNNQTAAGSNEGYGVGLNYAAGPLNVDYVFHHTDTSTAGSAGGSTATVLPNFGGTTGAIQEEHYVAGNFNAGFAKFLASAQFGEYNGKALNGRSTYQLYTLGAIVPVGKGNIHANYGLLDLNGNNRKDGAAGFGQSYTVGYTYGLSKRTVLYTALNYTDLAGNTQKPVYSGGTTVTNLPASSSQNLANVGGSGNGTVFGVGINHSF